MYKVKTIVFPVLLLLFTGIITENKIGTAQNMNSEKLNNSATSDPIIHPAIVKFHFQVIQ